MSGASNVVYKVGDTVELKGQVGGKVIAVGVESDGVSEAAEILDVPKYVVQRDINGYKDILIVGPCDIMAIVEGKDAGK